MDLAQAREDLKELQLKMAAYDHAIGLINYDGETSAPEGTADNRALTLGVLSGEMYKFNTAQETIDLLEYLEQHQDELDDKERRQVFLLLKSIRQLRKIPMDEYIAYQSLLVKSQDVWEKAKNNNDFESYRPYLEEVYATVKKFAAYCAPDKDPYDYWLNEYEEGMSMEFCDDFFGKLRERIVPLLKKIEEKPQIDVSFLKGDYPDDKQEELALYLMEVMGLDPEHVGLSTTEHPFTTSLGSHHDERITTHYHRDDFVSSLYSVVHEGGHALYDTGSADDLAYTVLDGGVSMGVHESQSRFYENIVGRSRGFIKFITPKLKELFPETLEGVTPEELYRAMNRVQPSLIRTEADEATYCLHVMVRYELEKAIMHDELQVKDLPEAWNKMYKDYLGVDVPDDTHGVLQDSHWSFGAIGYFPSYALGNAYGAQFLAKMKESVDVDACAEAGNLAPINDWNREHIWKHGALYPPKELIRNIVGEFSTEAYTTYLEEKFGEIYDL